MFNLSESQIQSLSALKSQMGGSKVSSFTTPTDCSSCWGGTCANGFTG